jgi:predicted nucleic acid-binding protein
VAALTEALERHELVGIDTSIFIYHLEASTRFANPASEALRALVTGAFHGVTSVITLMEISVLPLRLGRPAAADEYERTLSSFPHLQIVDVDRAVARQAAKLRATYRLHPADAIQVAACLTRNATAFLTNVKGLRRIADRDLVVLDDFAQHG